MASINFDLDYYFQRIERAGGNNPHGLAYMQAHRLRFEKTIEFIKDIGGHSALEIGATDFFQILLKEQLGFKDIWATIFTDDITKKLGNVPFEVGPFSVVSRTVSIDLEKELFPIADPRFDLVMLCEVIEHFDIDPMYALCELNRVMLKGGKLLVTTPNSCSARNAYKACLGYRPHFYMQYFRSRDPHRHNFEHDIHSLKALLEGAGFQLLRLETHDVFDAPDAEALEFLAKNKMPLEFRGDDIFILAEKVSDPIDRWPANVYV